MSETFAMVFISVQGRWGVGRHRGRRALRRFDTRAEAIRYGRALAKREGIVLYINDESGQPRSEYRPPSKPAKKK